MLVVDATKRITVAQALHHEWFKKFLTSSFHAKADMQS
jgi:hypothetical protein